MKKLILIYILLFSFFGDTVAQVFRPMTSRYNNPSVKGNIVFVANNIVTTPLANSAENPPGVIGTSLQITSNNGQPCANIDIDTDVPSHTSKIPFGSVWDYHSNGAAPANDVGGNTWKVPAYTMPAAWNAIGTAIPSTLILPPYPGKYGFSAPANATIATCIKSNGAIVTCAPGALVAKYSAYYFRKTVNFTAAELAAFSTVLINMKRIDGIVVYINGVERIRDNMPAGVINYGTFARNDLGFLQENTNFFADPSYFVAGVNTIAVEVHTAAAVVTNMAFDMEMLGIDNASTFNSSSATLNLNTCSQVLFAGLYWGANHQQNANSDTSWIKQETNLKLKIPGAAAYQTITSTQTDYHNGTRVAGLVHAGYACFTDITSLINTTNPNGVYTVGDIKTPVGWNSGGAGWTLVIAYANQSEVQRNLTVFDGSAIAKIGVTLTIPITGFLTPPSGPVSCELGAVVYDGDRTLLDNFFFKQDANPLAGAYTNMTPIAGMSLLNDMWNSTISTKGVLNPGRIPSHNNTLGFDADIIDVPNGGIANTVLGNNQTSASVRLGSTAEDFMAQVLTTSISIYNPAFAFDKDATDLSGGSLTAGDSLRYILSYDNVGNDASTNSRIIDNIPPGTAFKPGSIRINGVAKTDAAGDDEAEYDFTNNRIVYRLGTGANAATGGEIPAGTNGDVTFDIYTPSSCAVLSCSGTLRNRARMSYDGKLSLQTLQDSSGVFNSGCIDPVDKLDIVTGPCTTIGDTILTNICPALTVQLPIAKYAGYSFHTGIPFTPFNRYNPATAVTFTRVIYAYYDAPGACPDDTARINIFITACPDIDDDNDGIPDYVEINDPLALANWNNNTYPGFTDNNGDLFNDNFDPSADSDNDGNPNFYDSDFPGWLDSNGDGVNDTMDKDLDGIPNHLDLDSDNDGIPDTVESFGVDANGDGLIDNYSDSDNDGFSQNVDNVGGVSGSGLGLGPLDTDGDDIPNYLDLDSDNDGIPDITEAFGTDAGNSAKVSVFADTDGDGYTDILDADVGNDAVAENSSSSILRTGADGNNDGRTDTWPNKNMDADSKPSPYDLDSDGDGISDVKEAQFTDADWDGRIDGGLNTNGRNAVQALLPSLTIPNTDGAGRTNPYDIDSDNDGIPDNVEGLTTLGYLLPAYADMDGDGIDDVYDDNDDDVDINDFGGDGIHPCDIDGDTIPDYLDSDTDGDGLIDRVEGNDLNFNATPDDNVTLTGVDTDGDGLDDRFDNNNASPKATSRYMGNGGTTSGEIPPGSITTVQHSAIPVFGCPTERDWRCVFYVLNCEVVTFKAALQGQQTKLDWTVLCDQEVDRFIIERSVDGINFNDVGLIPGRPVVNAAESYNASDDVTSVTTEQIYYRLKTISRNGKIKLSNIIILRRNKKGATEVQILPNPVRSRLQLLISAELSTVAQIYIVDGNGKIVQKYTENVVKGSNTFTYSQTGNLPTGIYYLRLTIGNEIIIKKFSVIK